MAIRNPSPQPFLTLGCGTTTALDVVEVNVTLVHEEVVEVEPLVLCVIDVFVDIADVVETPQIFITPNPDMPTFPKFKKCVFSQFFGDLKLPTPCWSIMTCSNMQQQKQNTRSTFHAATEQKNGPSSKQQHSFCFK